MRQVKEVSTLLKQDPGAVFEAALGSAQAVKSRRILAVHNEGRRLIFREKSRLSNPKIVVVKVDATASGAEFHVVVGSDPRTPSAVLDGVMNDKALKKFVEGVSLVLGGSSSAPVTPVTNHYLQKKVEVPWVDATREPEIELDGNLLAIYGL